MRPLISMLLFLTLSARALAGDGVLEINQSCATQGGCFPGDAPGFPVTITQSGSYRLTGNLTLPLDTTAIDITASAVVVDLGGFAITGPNTCSGSPILGCTVNFGNPGIRANRSGQSGVTIRDGSISGMGGEAIETRNADVSSTATVVEDVFVTSNGGNAAIQVGALSRVSRCRVNQNRYYGILVGVFSLVDENILYANGASGVVFEGTGGGEALRNQMRFNRITGIEAPVGTITRENVISANLSGVGTLGSSQGNNLCNGVGC